MKISHDFMRYAAERHADELKTVDLCKLHLAALLTVLVFTLINH